MPPCPLRLGWGRSQGARGKCGSGLNVGTGLGEPHRSPTPPHHALAAADTHRLSTGPRHAGDAFRTRPAGETVETVSDFILGGSKITADGIELNYNSHMT